MATMAMGSEAGTGISSAMGDRLRVCTVCASNQNRSMAAHQELSLRGYPVRSYGTGKEVKLPGRTATEPVIYSFQTPYEAMHAELMARDEALYTSNGVLGMLERNSKIKRAPEQWRGSKEKFDLILTFEERIFDTVLEDFVLGRSPITFSPAYIANLETRDTHKDAALAAKIAAELVDSIAAAENIDAEMDAIVEDFEARTHRSIMVAPVFY